MSAPDPNLSSPDMGATVRVTDNGSQEVHPMKPILFLMPGRGYDPSEAAVSWSRLVAAGERVLFATPDGRPATADPLMLTGEGLDPWSRVPGLRRFKVVGLVLRANRQAREAHARMAASPEFVRPLRYDEVNPEDYDGVLLPGGHAKPMREFLENPVLAGLLARIMADRSAEAHLPVAAICHGVLALARARDAEGVSVIARRQVTALTWALEGAAWRLARHTRFWEPDYYRTYGEQPGEPAGFWSVESEIRRALAGAGAFHDVPPDVPDARRKTDGLHRDTPDDDRPAWVVRDGNLVTARWPGDANAFAARFLTVIREWRGRGRGHD